MRIGIEAQRIQRAKKHGMDVVAVELIRALQRLDTRNEYHIFCRNGVDTEVISQTPNFSTHTFPAFSYGDWEQMKLPALAKKLDLDVLHCTANTGPLKTVVPVLLTLHDIIFMEQLDFKGSMYQNAGNVYRRLVVPRLVKKCRFIITVSEFEKNNIVERLRLPEEKVLVVYNAVSERFHNTFSEAEVKAFREQYRLPEKYILFLGNTAPKKNTANVIKAYAAYCKATQAPVPMVLLDYSKELVEEQLKEMKQEGLISQFIFPGYVQHSQMPLVYNAATLFLYPSLRESFGLPILEAMACGVPVITSNTSSMPEVAGNAAQLVDPFSYESIAEGITTVLCSSSHQAALKQKGLERAGFFNWQVAAKQVLSLYERFKHSVTISKSEL